MIKEHIRANVHSVVSVNGNLISDIIEDPDAEPWFLIDYNYCIEGSNNPYDSPARHRMCITRDGIFYNRVSFDSCSSSFVTYSSSFIKEYLMSTRFSPGEQPVVREAIQEYVDNLVGNKQAS